MNKSSKNKVKATPEQEVKDQQRCPGCNVVFCDNHRLSILTAGCEECANRIKERLDHKVDRLDQLMTDAVDALMSSSSNASSSAASADLPESSKIQVEADVIVQHGLATTQLLPADCKFDKDLYMKAFGRFANFFSRVGKKRKSESESDAEPGQEQDNKAHQEQVQQPSAHKRRKPNPTSDEEVWQQLCGRAQLALPDHDLNCDSSDSSSDEDDD